MKSPSILKSFVPTLAILVFSQVAQAQETSPQKTAKTEALVKEVYQAAQGTLLEGCKFVFSGGRTLPSGSEGARFVELSYSHKGCANPQAVSGENRNPAEALRLDISQRVIRPIVIKLDDDLQQTCFRIDNWENLNVAKISLMDCEGDMIS